MPKFGFGILPNSTASESGSSNTNLMLFFLIITLTNHSFFFMD